MADWRFQCWTGRSDVRGLLIFLNGLLFLLSFVIYIGVEMEIRDDTLFGECKWCWKWVPRDSMVSVSVKVFGKGVDVLDEIIRLRICSVCFDKEAEMWRGRKWDDKMYRAEQIRGVQELSDRCDFIE